MAGDTADNISINQAVKLGIDRLRAPIWVDEYDHLKIDIFPDGTHGMWIKLYAPFNKVCNGRDPVPTLWGTIIDVDEPCYEKYTGPLPETPEYIQRAEEYGRIPT